MLINRTYRTYYQDYPVLYGVVPKPESISEITTTTTSTLPPFLYSGGTYVLTGTEFTVDGSTVTYDYVNNTARLDDPESATTIDCLNVPLDGNMNVSGCTSLIEITVFQTNIISLNLAGCSSLVDAYVLQDKFTSLNVSGCTSLDYLDCDNNNLISLDVSECTVLTYLDCYTNSLTSLNILGCTLLNYFDCDANALPELQIDGILAILVANGINGGNAQLNFGTNAHPSAAGMDNRQILLDAPRSWVQVLIN